MKEDSEKFPLTSNSGCTTCSDDDTKSKASDDKIHSNSRFLCVDDTRFSKLS